MSKTKKDSEKTPLWIILISFPVALCLHPIGTAIFTCAFNLNFFECCILIAAQIIVFVNLATLSKFLEGAK